MKTTKKNRKLETTYDAAKRILFGGAVDPSLSLTQIGRYVDLHDEAARRGDDESRDGWRKALMDKRRKNTTWDVVDEDGDPREEMPDAAVVAVLMDIREELRDLKQRFPSRRKSA